MTPLPPPQDNPRQRLQWAQEVLRVFSLPDHQWAVGAKQFRWAARKVIAAYQGKSVAQVAAKSRRPRSLPPVQDRQLDLFRDSRSPPPPSHA